LEIDQIEQRIFPIVRRGYDRAEVEAFLETIAAEYRQVEAEYGAAVQRANDAVRSAATEAASLSTSHTFENVGSHVASILSTASQAAGNLKAEAEQEAHAIRANAEEEAAEVRRAANSYLAEAQELRANAEQEMAVLRASVRADVDAILDAAREDAEQIETNAREEALRMERVSRTNLETLVADGRRELQHLRSLQQQCLDRLGSAEFLIQQAKEGISGQSPIPSPVRG